MSFVNDLLDQVVAAGNLNVDDLSVDSDGDLRVQLEDGTHTPTGYVNAQKLFEALLAAAVSPNSDLYVPEGYSAMKVGVYGTEG